MTTEADLIWQLLALLALHSSFKLQKSLCAHFVCIICCGHSIPLQAFRLGLTQLADRKPLDTHQQSSISDKLRLLMTRNLWSLESPSLFAKTNTHTKR